MKTTIKILFYSINFIISKIIKTIPYIKFVYDEISGNIYLGSSYGIPYKVKYDLFELKISDITNKKIQRTLKIEQFKKRKWYIYFVKNNIFK